MKKVEILKATKDLIADEKYWLQYRLEKPMEDGKTAYCVLGALWTVGTPHSLPWMGAFQAIDNACQELYKLDMVFTNNELGHAAIIKALDLAIQRS